jgi:transcriptional regulator with XRE-family HTH domain
LTSWSNHRARIDASADGNRFEAPDRPGDRASEDQRRLTQEDLAERLGRSVEAISNLERGRSFPSVKTLEALVTQLGVSLHELFGEPASDDSPRTRLELRGRALLTQLGDAFLEIAVEQLSALAKRDTRASAPDE